MPDTVVHISCNYFNEVVQHLQDTQPGFFLHDLAEKMDCTTQQIRRIRNGQFVLDLKDVSALKKYYAINPLFLLEGRLPMLMLTGELSIVKEPLEGYGNNLAEENKLLKQTIADKNEIIELLRAGKPQQHKKRA